MAWICSVESGELVLHLPNGSGRLPIAKLSPTPRRCLPQECQSEDCQSPQSGMMCERCQHQFFQQSQISFTEDSPARTSQLQDVERAWQESEADYLARSCDLSEKYNQPLFSSKTYQLSELVDLMQSLKKLPIVGMIVGGRIYQLRKLELTTGEIDSGSWATPNTLDHLPLRSKEALIRQFSTTRKGRTKPANLREQIHPECWPENLMLPTPTASEGGYNRSTKSSKIRPTLTMMARKNLFPTPDASKRGPAKVYNPKAKSQSGRTLQSYVATFPTPAARDWKDNGKSPAELARNSVTLATKAGGQLNPQWVEWLMGYPFEWTELNVLVMPLFPKQRGKRL